VRHVERVASSGGLGGVGAQPGADQGLVADARRPTRGGFTLGPAAVSVDAPRVRVRTCDALDLAGHPPAIRPGLPAARRRLDLRDDLDRRFDPAPVGGGATRSGGADAQANP